LPITLAARRSEAEGGRESFSANDLRHGKAAHPKTTPDPRFRRFHREIPGRVRNHPRSHGTQIPIPEIFSLNGRNPHVNRVWHSVGE
jgi:hypothetical protein